MKRITMAVAATLVFASFALADDDVNVSVRNDNTLNNTVTTTATSIANATGGNARATGGNSTLNYHETRQLIVAPRVGQPNPSNPMAAGEYGHQVSEFNLELSLDYMDSLNGVEFKTMIEIKNKEGEYDWSDVKGEIKTYPYIKKTLTPLSSEEKMHFMGGKAGYEWLLATKKSGGYKVTVVGPVNFIVKYNKKDKVIPADFQPLAYEYGAPKGANVAIIMEQFEKVYFVPEGFTWDLSAVISWAAKCMGMGGGASGGVGGQFGKNTKLLIPGIAVMYLHVEKAPCLPPVYIQPPPPCPPQSCNPSGILAQIEMWWAKCQLCKFFCFNNLNIRYNLAKLNIDLFACTGNINDLRVAEKHLEIAVQNYEQGTDTRSGVHAIESREMYKDSVYLLAGVYHVRGETSKERSIVKKHHLERWPKSFAQ